MIPRYYQQEAVDSVIGYILRNDKLHPLVAMPTGSGKSLIIAMLIEYVRKTWNANVLVLSHTEDILKQDHKAISNLINEEIGLYSAGLNSRSILPVTVAGIQSVYKRISEFNHFDFVIIDECHLINIDDETMYMKFLGGIDARYCGLTATPFRLKDGYIYGRKDTLFNDLVCDYTTLSNFNKLVNEGFLCNLKTLSTQLEFDTNSLHKRGGDYIEKEMSNLFDKEEITNNAIDETIRVATERGYKRWLIFAIDINHAEHIAERLIYKGIPTGLIHSRMEMNKQDVLDRHRAGIYTALVNVNILTTGYDDPEIDLIVMLRPTDSPVLHVQTIGRGLRIWPGKDHCMVLDFAGNTKRLGPINNVQVSKKKNLADGEGTAITKTCPECDMILPPAIKFCPECGYEFIFKTRLEGESDGSDIIDLGQKWYRVDDVKYQLSHDIYKPDMIVINYICNVKVFKEYWCLDHKGYARQRAIGIIRRRLDRDKDCHIGSCKDFFKSVDTLIKPDQILISTLKKYPEILQYKY